MMTQCIWLVVASLINRLGEQTGQGSNSGVELGGGVKRVDKKMSSRHFSLALRASCYYVHARRQVGEL